MKHIFRLDTAVGKTWDLHFGLSSDFGVSLSFSRFSGDNIYWSRDFSSVNYSISWMHSQLASKSRD